MMKYPCGDIYHGDWYGGERCGVGFMQYACGDVYQGRWSSDTRHGKGRYLWATGEEFLGDFYLGHPVTGIFVNRDGQHIEIKPDVKTVSDVTY
jgi:hypothetical protein